MNFDRIVDLFAREAMVADAQSAIRAVYETHATRWIAGEAGISQRTARRWMSDSPPASREGVIIELAGHFALAAQVMRRSSGSVSVGTVEVAYDDDDQGTRNIPDVDIDLDPIATALENGAVEYAEQAFSQAILSEYSPGLEDVLHISDYTDGISFS